MAELYTWLNSDEGWVLGQCIIYANIFHAVWLYVMWFFNRKPFDLFNQSVEWIGLTIVSAVLIFISGFIELVNRGSYNYDGGHPFSAIYITVFSVCCLIVGFIVLTQKGAQVRQRIKRRNSSP